MTDSPTYPLITPPEPARESHAEASSTAPPLTAPPMTKATPTDPDGSASAEDSSSGTVDVAKDQAASVGQSAAQAGQQVAGVAQDQAKNVVAEAGNQVKDVLGQAKTELSAQAGAQQQRLATSLHALGDELNSMTKHDAEPGVATDLAGQGSTRAHDIASWLENREPGNLLSELQGFARQRPGTFLLAAAGAGLLAGRLTRGVKDASSDESSDSSASATGAPRHGAASERGTGPSVVETEELPYLSDSTGFTPTGGPGL